MVFFSLFKASNHSMLCNGNSSNQIQSEKCRERGEQKVLLALSLSGVFTDDSRCFSLTSCVSQQKKKKKLSLSIYTYHIFHNISHSLVPSKCWCHVARDYIMYMTAWFFPLLISNMQTLQQALDVKHHKTGRLCRFWPV